MARERASVAFLSGDVSQEVISIRDFLALLAARAKQRASS
jgi:hypothetical protein